MDHSVRLAAASRDSHLALRRVERQQLMIERLHRARGERVPLAALARALGVSERTAARDVERLRLSGVPLVTHRGSNGGVSLRSGEGTRVVSLDLPELAALLSSLAVLGPSVSESASSAMRKLAAALAPADRPGGRD
jgi:predicted DNA-binding transcriptional regulator YafY